MDIRRATTVMGDIFTSASLFDFNHQISTKEHQRAAASGQRGTLHYHPQARKQADLTWKRSVPDFRLPDEYSTSSCRMAMDAVDENFITDLCYALELDKLYVLPDLRENADIVNRI